MSIKRGYSPSEVIKKKNKVFDFQGAWYKAIGKPETSGIWIIYGESGNGKSSFVMQLAKYLCEFTKVIYNSIEEGISESMKQSLLRHNMSELDGKFRIYDRLEMSELKKMLKKRGSAQVAIIDSIQKTNFRKATYESFMKGLEKKLIIFISQVDNIGRLKGALARDVEYDAMVKIQVSGFQAFCKTRYAEQDTDNIYKIWDEKSVQCWGNEI